MIIAHTLIDAVAFIGYALLVGHVSWLTVIQSFQFPRARLRMLTFFA